MALKLTRYAQMKDFPQGTKSCKSDARLVVSLYLNSEMNKFMLFNRIISTSESEIIKLWDMIV